MAAQATADVHLEAMETAENKGAKPAKAGGVRVAGLPMGKFSLGILAYRREPRIVSFYNQRKARTGRIL